MAKAKKQEESIEKQLWKAADKLRKNIDAAEYKHVVMGLVFLKYISDSFEELYNSLKAEEEKDLKADFIIRRTKVFSHENTDYVAKVYHDWKTGSSEYEDIKGLCKSASQDEVRELNFVLTPGRYVGLEVVDDEFDFKERFTSLQEELKEQMKEEQELNKRINDNLARFLKNSMWQTDH